MKKSEIEIGGHYTAKVNGQVVTVRVDMIRNRVTCEWLHGRDRSVYDVTDLTTGRKTIFRSAQQFRAPAAKPERKAQT